MGPRCRWCLGTAAHFVSGICVVVYFRCVPERCVQSVSLSALSAANIAACPVLSHSHASSHASLFVVVLMHVLRCIAGPLDAFLPSLQTAYNTTGELVKAVCGSESGKKMSDEAIVRCMRGAHINSLVENSFAPSLRRQWSPVLDGIYLQGAADEALITGRVNRTVHQVMLGTTANDATAILYFMLQVSH